MKNVLLMSLVLLFVGANAANAAFVTVPELAGYTPVMTDDFEGVNPGDMPDPTKWNQWDEAGYPAVVHLGAIDDPLGQNMSNYMFITDYTSGRSGLYYTLDNQTVDEMTVTMRIQARRGYPSMYFNDILPDGTRNNYGPGLVPRGADVVDGVYVTWKFNCTDGASNVNWAVGPDPIPIDHWVDVVYSVKGTEDPGVGLYSICIDGDWTLSNIPFTKYTSGGSVDTWWCTAASGYDHYFDDVSVYDVYVPEPTTVCLLGLGGLLLRRRK